MLGLQLPVSSSHRRKLSRSFSLSLSLSPLSQVILLLDTSLCLCHMNGPMGFLQSPFTWLLLCAMSLHAATPSFSMLYFLYGNCPCRYAPCVGFHVWEPGMGPDASGDGPG